MVQEMLWSIMTGKELNCVLMQNDKMITYASRQSKELKEYECCYPTHDLKSWSTYSCQRNLIWDRDDETKVGLDDKRDNAKD